MSRGFTWAMVGVVAALASGCGASKQYPASSPASEAPPAPSDAAPKSEGYPQQAAPMAPPSAGAAPTASPPAPAPVAPSADAEMAAPTTASRAPAGDRDLEAAERGVASSDCPTACRALGSMERAVVFICVSNQDEGDAARCGDAKVRLRAARRRVRSTCAECPSGPSVDPNAPVPSRR